MLWKKENTEKPEIKQLKAVGHGKIQRDRKSKLCIQGKLVQLLRKNKRKKGDKNDRTKEK